MLAKLALLLQGKLAALAVATAVATTGGATVAVVATHEREPVVSAVSAPATSTPAHKSDAPEHSTAKTASTTEPTEATEPTEPTATATATATPEPTEEPGDEMEHVNGTLLAYDAQANTVTVQTGGDSAPVVVTMDANTTVSGSGISSSADLAQFVGSCVEVAVMQRADGTLLARTVTVTSSESKGDGEDANDVSLEGVVTSVTAEGFTMSVEGASVTVSVSDQTGYAGVTDLSDMKVGAQVEVKGTRKADGSVAAVCVMVDSDSSENSGSGTDGSQGTGESGTDSGSSQGTDESSSGMDGSQGTGESTSGSDGAASTDQTSTDKSGSDQTKTGSDQGGAVQAGSGQSSDD